MDHSFNLCLILVSFSMLFTLSFARPNIEQEANTLISRICIRTQNSDLCNKILGSTPGASTADVKGLGYISIDIGLTYAKQKLSYITTLAERETSPEFKCRYDSCAKLYASTVDNLYQSKKFLDSGDIQSLFNSASDAYDGPINCEDNFEGLIIAPAELNEANVKLEAIVGILVAVQNWLL